MLQVWRGRLVGWKDREERNSTGNLQVAADGAGADSGCRALVSSVLALAAQHRRFVRRARSGGGSHDDLALGSTLQSRTGTAAASFSSSRRTNPGVSMRHTFESRAVGVTSIGPSIPRVPPSTSCCRRYAMPRRPSACSARRSAIHLIAAPCSKMIRPASTGNGEAGESV